MKVADVMSGPVWVIRPEDSLTHARQEMINRGVKKLPVVGDDGRLEGILSLTDIAFAGDTDLARERGMSVTLNALVRDVMQTRVVSLKPQEDIRRAIREMTAANVRSAPVVEDKKILGIVTGSDLLAGLLRDETLPTSTVGDLMTPEVVTVHRHTALPRVLNTLREHNLHQVPVEEAADVIVGMASIRNIVFGSWFEPNLPIQKRIQTAHKLSHAGRKSGRHVELVHVVAEDVMDTEFRILTSDQGVSAAANVMVKSGYDALPVLEGNVPVGMITRWDILRAASQSPDVEETRGKHVYEGPPPHTTRPDQG